MTHVPTAPGSGEPPEIGDRVRAAEAVVAAALAAFQAQEWEVVVALTDADSIAELRRRYLENKARRLAPPLHVSWEADDPEAEAMRELLAQMAEMPVTFHELAGVSTLEEARALDATEFMVRWAQARHAGYLEAHGLREAGWMPERVVVGSVAVVPDTVAVLVRIVNVLDSHPIGALGLIGVLGDGRGEWRLDAELSWLGLADGIVR